MAHWLTTMCEDELRARLVLECANLRWTVQQALGGVGTPGGRVLVDVYGESDDLVVCIELEMHRHFPGDNAVKLHQLLQANRQTHPFDGKKVFVLQVFSPFYEVGPFFERSNECERMWPGAFRAFDVTYFAFRWNLDEFREIRKICQVLPDLAIDSQHQRQLRRALVLLASDLGDIIK
jgi:hypothetical protein